MQHKRALGEESGKAADHPAHGSVPGELPGAGAQGSCTDKIFG